MDFQISKRDITINSQRDCLAYENIKAKIGRIEFEGSE